MSHSLVAELAWTGTDTPRWSRMERHSPDVHA